MEMVGSVGGGKLSQDIAEMGKVRIGDLLVVEGMMVKTRWLVEGMVQEGVSCRLVTNDKNVFSELHGAHWH